MARQLYEMTNFKGGLNCLGEPRDIDDNEFAQNWNIMVDREGVLRVAGLGQHEIPASTFSSDNFHEGFGLFQFSVDYSLTEIDTGLLSGIEQGTIHTYTSTTAFVLADTASVSSTDDYYNNWTIFIYSGTGAGESRLITDYTGSSRTITCEAFATTLHDKDDGTPSKYIIYRWKTDGTNWHGSAAKKDIITDGTTPISAISSHSNDKYYFISKKTSITDEQSVNLGYIEYEPNLTLEAGVEYSLTLKASFKYNWFNYVSNGVEDGSGTPYGDKPPWIELYSETVTDGTNTKLSLYANNTWVSETDQAGYKSLVDSNFVDNGDFTNGANEWTEVDLGGVLSVAEEAGSDAYGTHDGTLTMTAAAGYAWANGAPASFIYQQLSLDDNTPYHLNFVYGSSATGITYSVVDVTNLVATGIITNLGSTISDTGDGLTSGDSLTCNVDGVTATSDLLLNKYIYKSDGTFVGKCTVINSGTQITLGGGVAVDLANDVQLYTERVIIPWRGLPHTGGLTTYKFANESDSNYSGKTSEYITFNVPDNGSGTETNIQIRFANAGTAASNVNLAGVTVYKAFNDLVSMGNSNNANNPFLGSTNSWSTYRTKFTIPSGFISGGNKSDWVLRIHAGAYGYRANATNASATQEVYITPPIISSNKSDTITALSDNNANNSTIALHSNNSGIWDKHSLIWGDLGAKPTYDYINGFLKLSDGNFTTRNQNMILYYNNRKVEHPNYGFDYSDWIVEENIIPTPPSLQVLSVSTSPYSATKFNAIDYLNLLHSGEHYRQSSGGYDATNWNSDEFGVSDGTGAPFGNGHIVRYHASTTDPAMTVAELKLYDYGRHLPNPDSTADHSTNLGILFTANSQANTVQDAQNPVYCRIQGVDAVHTAEDMDSTMSAGNVAKIQYSILWEISAFVQAGATAFPDCTVPSFRVKAGKASNTMTTDNTTGNPGSLKDQEMVTMGFLTFVATEIATQKTMHHGVGAQNTGVTIREVISGDREWDNVQIVSYNHAVGENDFHSEMTVLLQGEISWPTEEVIAKTNDIVFSIEEVEGDLGADATHLIGVNGELLNCLSQGIDATNSHAETYQYQSVFTRFMFQTLDVVFYDSAFDQDTDVNFIDGTVLNFVWGAPSGGSSTGWGERTFKVGVSSVNYFDEESAINESPQEISAVTAGYSPEVTAYIAREVLFNPYLKKTKFYMKDNETDIWYLQFYIDHDTIKFYSTTSGKSEFIDTLLIMANSVLKREDLKDFNEVNSYESETMVSQEDAVSNFNLTCRYKASVVANNRLYVGNIKQNGKTHGDRMIKSPIGKYNLLPKSNFIDVAINDGDEITALAYYKDKLLQFKKRKVFVINTSGDYEFLEDTFHDTGVKGQCSVVTTPHGIAWSNINGCYLYDGAKLTNLIENKIPNDTYYTTIASAFNKWNPGGAATNNSKNVIGYIEDKDSLLIIFSDKTLTATNYPTGATYHFGTNSWTLLFQAFSVNSSGVTGNFSNMITNQDGDVMYYHHVSGSEALHVNEIKKWNHNPVEDSNFSITTKNFYFYTKDITFGNISDVKTLYRVYITYRVKRDGTDSGVAVTGAVNGSNSFDVEFSTSSTFKGTATACYGSSTLDETDGIWKTAELKFGTPSEVKNISTLQLRLIGGPGAFDFEVNDISISYRVVRRR